MCALGGVVSRDPDKVSNQVAMTTGRQATDSQATQQILHRVLAFQVNNPHHSVIN
jgi:hypothetical protein